MKLYELLDFNKELLKRLFCAGIKPEDYRYVDLFTDYEHLCQEGRKKDLYRCDAGRQIRYK